METSLQTFRREYLEMLLRFLWREWTALGVAGQRQSPVRHVVDPDALLLFTCSLGRYDQRLFDEALDWLTVNGRFLNVQRMRNILRGETFRGGRVLGAVADWLSRRKRPAKWRLLAEMRPSGDEREALFYLPDGRPSPPAADTDPVFMDHGFTRSAVALRGYSQAFPADTMPCLFLKMRALFGVNARCDVLTYLTMNPLGHPRQVAREMYYSQKAIHDVMADMACSGVVPSTRLGRERTFRIDSSCLPFLTGGASAPGWINWPILLSAAETVWETVEELRMASLDPLVESSEMALRLKPLLQGLSQAPWVATLPAFESRHGIALLEAFEAAFESLAA